MSLVDWLRELAECQSDPESIDFDGAEEALHELRQRCQTIYSTYTDENDPNQAQLLEMADLLGQVAENLQLFLDSGLFFHVQEAARAAQEMMQLREGLERQVEEEESERV